MRNGMRLARFSQRALADRPQPHHRPGYARTQPMALQFAKYEGLGNDFVVVEALETALSLDEAHARALCDRHRGIGADGVLLIEGDPAHPRMRVINADGSQPEMCGNGLRCVALHLVRRGFAPVGQDFLVETDAGPHRCRVASAERESIVEVSMRPASLVPREIPVVSSGEAAVLDEPFSIAGTQVKLSCVSMGNPHAVTFEPAAVDARQKLGPLLEKHERFPKAANIGFARVLGTVGTVGTVGTQEIELAVWERGVGFTEACGTGACACAVAAVETGRVTREQPVIVKLPGGPLEIRVGARGDRISMKGPARHVFDGTFVLR
jgi:diaminopimelate epimerase